LETGRGQGASVIEIGRFTAEQSIDPDGRIERLQQPNSGTAELELIVELEQQDEFVDWRAPCRMTRLPAANRCSL
jgi:hypothetical protein